MLPMEADLRRNMARVLTVDAEIRPFGGLEVCLALSTSDRWSELTLWPENEGGNRAVIPKASFRWQKQMIRPYGD
jgi:hypothetical protein